MKEYISKDEIIEHFSKRVSCPAGEDNSKERYRYIQWATDYNSIISIPAVKAIPLDKVIQAVEEMQKEIEENHLNVIEYADGEWIVKDFVYGAIERLKRNLESED